MILHVFFIPQLLEHEETRCVAIVNDDGLFLIDPSMAEDESEIGYQQFPYSRFDPLAGFSFSSFFKHFPKDCFNYYQRQGYHSGCK